VVGRHRIPLLDAPFWIFFQILTTFHVVGTYEVSISDTGEPTIMRGMPAPDFEGKEWKTQYIYWEGDPSKPISSEAVLEAVTRAFMLADIDAG
jgi:hypothetical protein